jgi:hypothetical protein
MAKVLRYGFLALLLITLLLLLLPWLFRDEIFERIKQEANANLKGELLIEDMSLSLFRDFPNLTVTLKDVAFINEAPFSDQKLVEAETIRAELDIASVFSGDQIQINEVYFGNLNAYVEVREDGSANYLIMKSADSESTGTDTVSSGTSGNFNVALNNFEIDGFNITYKDAESKVNVIVQKGNFQLAGKLNEVESEIKTITKLEALTCNYEGIDYLSKVAVQAEINARYNRDANKLVLTENEVTVNNLLLKLDGWLQSLDDRISLDLAFHAPSTDFKEVLSLVPVVYMHDFQEVKTSGSFSLTGNVNGDYFYEGDDLPAFGLSLQVNKASFSYPDLPESVENINITARIDHPVGVLDNMLIDISKANMEVAGSPFHMQLNVAHPISNPLIDFDLQTRLDLEKVQRAVALDDYSMKGILEADVHIKGKLSDFEHANYNAIEAEGYFQSGSMDIATTQLAEHVQIDTLYTSITPNEFKLQPLVIQLGQSDFTGSGQLDNMLAYALTDDTLSGSFNLQSDNINITELMDMLTAEETSGEGNLEPDTSAEESAFVVPEDINLRLIARAKNVRYTNVDLQDVRSTLLIKDGEITLTDVSSTVLGGTLVMQGGYKMQHGKPYVDAAVNLRNIDAKQSFTTFNTVQRFAPVAESASGSYGGSLQLATFLDNDYSPNLTTLNASGSLLTKALILQPEVMKLVGDILGSSDYSKVRFEDADMGFAIEDGRVNVNPVAIRIGGHRATFSGHHSLDQKMDYRLKTELPIEKIELPAEIAALGILKGTIPVEFEIGGTLANPTVNPVFGQSKNLDNLITDAVEETVDEVKDSVITLVNNQAEQIMADAKKQADLIKAEAAQQAAKLKAEAQKQADALKAEARKQADALRKEAKGDPLKEFAAKTAADALIKEADKKIDELNAEANKQANDLLSKAEIEAERIMKEAEKRAKVNEQ